MKWGKPEYQNKDTLIKITWMRNRWELRFPLQGVEIKYFANVRNFCPITQNWYSFGENNAIVRLDMKTSDAKLPITKFIKTTSSTGFPNFFHSGG